MNFSIQNTSVNTPRFISRPDGVSRCSRYAFGPNRLHMCGPDKSYEVLAYIQENESDQGLANIMQDFATMYPYLRQIAYANGIRDSFDERVIEAYWLGNELLDLIPQKVFYRHLIDNLRFRQRMDWRTREGLIDKLAQGAKMHHSFHVFNIWQRTGHTGTIHTLRSMDQCRISWGKVSRVAGPTITVMRPPLIVDGHKLKIGKSLEVLITRELEKSSIIDDVVVNDYISMHWGVPCEILNEQQVKNLKKYTQQSLVLANLTI